MTQACSEQALERSSRKYLRSRQRERRTKRLGKGQIRRTKRMGKDQINLMVRKNRRVRGSLWRMARRRTAIPKCSAADLTAKGEKL